MAGDGQQTGPGGRLRAARAAMNVEVREVADALNLPTTTIDAIEANAFDLLPNRVFARGYVRAYAKLVELDPDPIVQAFQEASEPHAEAHGSAVNSVTLGAGASGDLQEQLGDLRLRLESKARENPGLVLGVAAGGLLLLLLLLWLLLRGDSDTPADLSGAPEAGQPAVAARSAGVAPEALPGVAPGAGDTGVVIDTQAADQAQRGGFTDVEEPSRIAEPEPAAGPFGADIGSSGDASSVVRLGPGDDRLQLRFVADCWVEVRNAEDRVLYSDLGQSNKQLEMTGQGPFRILLGYAPGVELAFNGEKVVLTPHTRNDVARLVLGQ